MGSCGQSSGPGPGAAARSQNGSTCSPNFSPCLGENLQVYNWEQRSFCFSLSPQIVFLMASRFPVAICCWEERNGPVLIRQSVRGFYIEEPQPRNGAVPSFKGSCAARHVWQKCAPRGVLPPGLPLTGCLSQDPPGAWEFCISFLAPTHLLQQPFGSCSRGLAPEKKPSQR